MRTGSSGKSLVAVGLLALVLVGVASAANFLLTKSAETNNTISFTYPKQTGDGYRYYAPGSVSGSTCSGTVVSRTLDPNKTSVKFSKVPSGQYCVEAVVLTPVGAAQYPAVTPPPPKPQCSDSADNDGDGLTDYPADPGCSGATDNDETNAPPPPPTGTVINVSGTVSGSTLSQQISQAPSGPVTVRGAFSPTVTGGILIGRPDVALERLAITSTVQFNPSADRGSLSDSTAMGFDVFGADNIVIQGNAFDGKGQDNQNILWDQPAFNGPVGYRISGNSFQNFYRDGDGSHSEALFVGGGASNGLIENNTFTNNGNTAHIFFSWFGTAATTSNYPRNVCVRGNTYGPRHGAFFDVNFREEIPNSAGIKVTDTTVVTNTAFLAASC